MARKLIYASLIAALCWTTVPAQPDVAVADDDLVLRTHSLEGIPFVSGDDDLPPRLVPTARILRLEAPDHYSATNVIRPGQWHSLLPSEAGKPMDAIALAYEAIELVRTESWEDWNVSQSGISWKASPNEHETLAWLLDQVRAYYAQRIRFAVFELREAAQSGTVSVEQAAALRRNASLLATRTAQSREIALISTLRSFDYVADYELNVATSAAVPAPLNRTMHTGREMTLSACPAPDGSLFVRAVRGRSTLLGMRAFEGHIESGIIEQPDFQWTREEGAVRLRDGEGWVFGDRYLIMASVAQPFTAAWHPTKPLALLSPDLLLRRESHENLLIPGATPRHVAYGGDYHRQQHHGPATERDDLGFAKSVEEMLPGHIYERLAATGASFGRLGPLICLSWETGTPSRLQVEAPTPAAVSLRVRQWRVARDHPFPEDLLNGSPTTQALSRLGNPAYDRHLSQFEGGHIEDSHLSFSNFVASYNTSTATSVAVHEPVVRSLITGTRLAIELGKDGRGGVPVEVLFGFAPPGEIKTSQAVIPKRAVPQTATVSATAMRLGGTLRVGESISAISPMPDNPNLLIVLAVTRLEP